VGFETSSNGDGDRNSDNIQLAYEHYEPIPAGTYAGFIDKAERASGLYGEQLRIYFMVTCDGENRTLSKWANLKFSKKSTLLAITAAALGIHDAAMPRDHLFDKDADLIGREVRVEVDVVEGKDGDLVNKIVKVLPLMPVEHPGVAVAATKQGEAAAPPEDDDDNIFSDGAE